MTDVFAPHEMERLSAEIDAQLRELGTPGTGLSRGGSPEGTLGAKQWQAIEAATGQDAITFLARFKQAAHKDLCEQGGVLVGMGLSGAPLQIAVVAIAVYVLYLGVQAFCAEG